MDLKAKPFYLSDEDIKWVEETKASLTLDEKLGQLFFPIGYSPNEQYLQYEILSKNPGGLMFRTGKTEELDPKDRQKIEDLLVNAAKKL